MSSSWRSPESIAAESNRGKCPFECLGCYFEFETGAIDVDFGPDDRFDGFDIDRLINFIQLSKLPKYEAIKDFQEIDKQYYDLIGKGIILCPKLHPSTHLCYLNG